MATVSTTPLAALQALGQSVWLDDISRKMLHAGDLKRLIDDDGLQGMTSNPSIFQKAIGLSADYDEEIKSMVARGRRSRRHLRGTGRRRHRRGPRRLPPDL